MQSRLGSRGNLLRLRLLKHSERQQLWLLCKKKTPRRRVGLWSVRVARFARESGVVVTGVYVRLAE